MDVEMMGERDPFTSMGVTALRERFGITPEDVSAKHECIVGYTHGCESDL
jgi:hypothetical protein